MREGVADLEIVDGILGQEGVGVGSCERGEGDEGWEKGSVVCDGRREHGRGREEDQSSEETDFE